MGKLIKRRRNTIGRFAPNTYRMASYAGRMIGRAYKRWRGRTRTVTKTRKRSNNVVKSGYSGISSSGARYRAKLYPSVRTVLRGQQLSVWKTVDTTRIEWDAGRQSVNNFTVGTIADLRGLFSNIGASATGQDTTRMVVKSMRMKLAFTNQSNANAIVTMYDIEYRNNMVDGSDNATPALSFANGIIRTEDIGVPTYLDVGATPYQSSDFCRNYRVTKVTKIHLDPGKSHIHYVNLVRNKMLNNGQMDDTVSLSGIKGFTHACLMVCQGLPVNDGTTDTLIAYGSGAISLVEERTYNQCFPQYGLKRYFLADNQGSITTEKIINDETNAPDTYGEV